MGTRLEHYRITPDGLVKDTHSHGHTTLQDESVFFPDATLNGQESCVQVSDEEGETIIEVFTNNPEPEEIILHYPINTFDIPLVVSEFDSVPTKLVRVVHTEEAAISQQEIYFFNPN